MLLCSNEHVLCVLNRNVQQKQLGNVRDTALDLRGAISGRFQKNLGDEIVGIARPARLPVVFQPRR